MAIKMRSKYSGTCKTCGGSVNIGQEVFWTPGQKGVSHTLCPDVSIDTDKITAKRLVNIQPPSTRDDFPDLFKHQQEVVNTVEKAGGAVGMYLAFDPGLGKTLSSLAAAEVRGAFPLIVVCPAVVKINWQRETKRWIGREAQILSGKTPGEINKDIVIINYEVLEHWADTLIALEPKGIVLDEIHYVKNKAAARTKAAIKVAEEVDGLRLGLSGTSTPNSVYDLMAPLKILGALDAFGGEKKYINRYCPPVQSPWGVSYKRSRNLKELHENLKAVGYLRRKREDCLDLPEKIISEIPIKVKTQINREFYQPLVDKMASGTLVEAMRVLDETDRDRVYAEFLREREAVGQAKVPDIVNIAKDIDEPLVIMVHHKSVVASLMEKLKARKPAKIVGGMTPKARQQSIDDFQDGKTDVLICSIDAAGIGINLQRGTQMIIGELPFTAAQVEQAESRCHRSGSKNDLTVYRLLALNTTDEMLMGIINKKEAVSAEVEDGESLSPRTYGPVLARKLVSLYKQSNR